MNLVFADPSLKGKADSSTAWYQYLAPELKTYLIEPMLFCHAEADSEIQIPLRARPVFRQYVKDFLSHAPDPQTALGQFETLSEALLKDLARFTGLSSEDCIFVNEACLPQLNGTAAWLKGFAPATRPRIIVQFAVSDLKPFAEGSRDPEILLSVAGRLKPLLGAELRTNLKLVAADEAVASYLESVLEYPVECWPSPQRGRKDAPERRAKNAGRLVAILGHQTAEKGVALVPELASQLLAQHPDSAMLVHSASPTKVLGVEHQLLALEKVNKRLVLLHGVLPFDRWQHILSSIDLAILPYEPNEFRHRGSWLLDEFIAHGVPALVPAQTEMAKRLRSFGVTDQEFQAHTPESICAAVDRVLSRSEAMVKRSQAAQTMWNATQGAQRVAANLLSWFPEPRPRWKGWPGFSAEGPAKSSSAQAPLIKDGNRPKRVLMSWAIDPSYIPPPVLSECQVTLGPHPLTTVNFSVRPNGRGVSDGYTPFRHTYDLEEAVKIQGIQGPFDLVVVFTESTFGNIPVNLKAFGCPTVLYAGDTHWGPFALKGMVTYAAGAGFDYVVSTYNRQHLHWFTEAGKQQVAWIPGMAVQHFPQPFCADRQKKLAFVGQTKEQHSRRLRLFSTLEQHGVPVNRGALNRAEAAALYNRCVLSFNTSLNGDLNLRNFEVMSAGGCLLSDRLAPESGQHLLFEEGQHYVGYSDQQEMVEMARRFMAHPDAAAQIAKAGHKLYSERFLPEHQAASLVDWVFSGKLKSEYSAGWDGRAQLGALDSVPLETRIAIYEEMQESHRIQEFTHVLVGPGVSPSIIADMVDLPRLACTVLDGERTVKPILQRYGLENRVHYLESDRCQKLNRTWDYLILADASPAMAGAIPHKQLLLVSEAQKRQKSLPLPPNSAYLHKLMEALEAVQAGYAINETAG
jgi:hypothetical protein